MKMFRSLTTTMMVGFKQKNLQALRHMPKDVVLIRSLDPDDGRTEYSKAIAAIQVKPNAMTSVGQKCL